MSGSSNYVEYIVAIQCCRWRVHDLDDLLETLASDALELDLPLITLFHSTSKHWPEVVRTWDEYHFVHVESFTYEIRNKTVLSSWRKAVSN